MTTIKSYTDLEQSKKLAKILPLESADMYYKCGAIAPNIMIVGKQNYRCYTICWSLAALLGVLPNGIIMNKDSQNGMYFIGTYFMADNPVDACYEMILMLHKLKML